MEPRTKRLLLGCGGGCAAVVLALVAGCASLTMWLRAPGELLEPRALLDPDAIGYVEARLELDNPGTEALVQGVIELMESQQPTEPPLARMFYRWNLARQERDLRRAFPARVVWTIFPAPPPRRTESVASVSIQRAGHQLLLADWIFEWALGRAGEQYVLEHRGERVLVIRDAESETEQSTELAIEQSGEPGETTFTAPAESREDDVYYLFLRGEGAFFATGERVVRRVIDRLEGAAPIDEPGPTRLDELVASIPQDRQLRGALLDDDGELVALVEPLLEELPETEAADARAALAQAEAATIAGAFEPSGDAVLELELVAPPEARPALLDVLSRVLARVGDREELDRSLRETDRGVGATLRIRDVAAVVREAMDESRAADPTRSGSTELVPQPVSETGHGPSP